MKAGRHSKVYLSLGLSYSPCKKTNGKIRPCVDNRRVNSVTVKDAFPLPRTQDCLDAVAGANYFSTVDMTSGYYQVPVHKDDIPKTAFTTKYGLFELKTMPMGLCRCHVPTCNGIGPTGPTGPSMEDLSNFP